MRFNVSPSLVWLLSDAKLAYVFAAAVVVWLGYAPLRRWALRRIPGPRALPFLGNLPSITSRDFTYFGHEVSVTYGPVSKMWFGMTPWVMVSDPTLIRKIAYKSSARSDISALSHMLTGTAKEVDSEMSLWARGPSWKASRRAFESSVMHPEKLRGHVPTILRCIHRFLPYLASRGAGGEAVNLKEELGNLTLAITGEVAFGVEFWPKSVLEAEARRGVQTEGERAVDASSTAAKDDGAELLAAVSDCFSCLEIRNATVYLPLQMIFPSLRPLWRWLAEHCPDAAQRRHMRARQMVATASRQLMERWHLSKAAAAAAAATVAPEATAIGNGGTGESLPNGGSGELHGNSNGNSNGIAAKVGNGDENGSIDAMAFREAASSGGISSSSFLAAMLEDRQRPASDRAAELELPKLTDLQVVSQVLLFMIAGFDTTSTTLTNTMFCLASHPAVQDRLRSELTSHPGCQEDMELLGQLPYLDAVLKESQRMYPVVSQLVRDLPADLDVGGGIVLRKGDMVALNVYTVHYDPALWPQPERFLPERHLPEGKAALGQDHPAALIPFGLGPRMCVGHKLATMITKATLAALLLRFRVELHPRQKLPLKLKTGLTLSPKDGVWVTLSELAAA